MALGGDRGGDGVGGGGGGRNVGSDKKEKEKLNGQVESGDERRGRENERRGRENALRKLSGHHCKSEAGKEQREKK